MVHLQASGLSRLLEWNQKFDAGVISASRKYNNCGYKIDNMGNETDVPCPTDELGRPVKEQPQKLSKDEIKKATKALATELRAMGYCITRVKGKYPEGGKEVVEDSIFVVDCKNKGTLKRDLIKMGIKYKQDSVLILPKGALDSRTKIKGYLVGTNKCCNNWLGFKKIYTFEAKPSYGKEGTIYTSTVNGRPFFLVDEYNKPKELSSGFGSSSQAMLAGKIIKEYDKTVPMKLINSMVKEFNNV